MTTTRGRSRGSRRWTALGVAMMLVGLLAYAMGLRLNLATRSVPVPAVGSSADQVVTAYVAAYDARDFATMRAIYPSGVPSRFSVLGSFDDLQIVDSHVPSRSEQDGRDIRPEREYRNVRVTLTIRDLGGSDLSYPEGPNGWTYWLEHADAQHRWQILDHGNG